MLSKFIQYADFTALTIITLLVTLFTLQFSNELFTHTDIVEYGRKYAQSQYILGESSPKKISDAELYVYAGYAYFKGEDPTTINFEHPPLGKYLFGFSYYLTGNSVQINILLHIATLFLFYVLSKRFIDSFFVRIMAVVTLGTQPLFSSLLPHAVLDVQFLITILGFYLALSWKTTRLALKYAVIGVILGVMASIKYPFPFMAVPGLILLIGAWMQKEIRWVFLSLPIMGVVYLIQYLGYFIHGHSLVDFIKFELYRFNWWTGERTAPKFLIFENLFTGRHRAWWEPGTYHYTKEWTPFLPAIFVLSLPSFMIMKKNIWTQLFFVFSLVMVLLFAVGAANSLRYLLITLPIWILTLFSAFEKITQIKQ
jgi:hypothetical protein